MKKTLTLAAAALVAFAMTGCDKKGTVEGVVLDPFTGKNVEMPTVWMDSTFLVPSLQSTSTRACSRKESSSSKTFLLATIVF